MKEVKRGETPDDILAGLLKIMGSPVIKLSKEDIFAAFLMSLEELNKERRKEEGGGGRD